MKGTGLLAISVLLAALIPLFATASESSKPVPATLKIASMHPLDDVYLEVSLEFPKAWENPSFRVLVDGREVNARSVSGGYSGDVGTADLIAFPGAPGTKRVSVVAAIGGRRVEATGSVDWGGKAFAAVLGYAGERTLVTAAEKIRIVTANVDDPRITFNGVRMAPEAFGRDAVPLSVDPQWRSGLNTLSLEDRGADGGAVSRAYTFVFSRDGIREGENALLGYGTAGTKSGPFYSVTVEGDAVEAGPDRMVDSCVVDDRGWIGRETLLVRELKAAKPGRARIVISEKPHFLQESSVRRELTLTVLPAGK